MENILKTQEIILVRHTRELDLWEAILDDYSEHSILPIKNPLFKLAYALCVDNQEKYLAYQWNVHRHCPVELVGSVCFDVINTSNLKMERIRDHIILFL